MSRFGLYVGKFLHILIGYGVACLAVSAFVNVLFLGAADFTPEEVAWIVASGPLVVSIPIGALVIGYFAFLPAMAAAVITEVLDRRDWLVHALAGGAVALIVTGFSTGADLTTLNWRLTGTPLGAIAAGIIGGIAYWLVTGRYAGSWRAMGGSGHA